VTLTGELTAWQDRLLAAMADDLPPEQVRRLARDTAPDEAVRGWIDSWEDDHVELAGVLVRTWVARTAPSG
jgi:hypothetical protein